MTRPDTRQFSWQTEQLTEAFPSANETETRAFGSVGLVTESIITQASYSASHGDGHLTETVTYTHCHAGGGCLRVTSQS